MPVVVARPERHGTATARVTELHTGQQLRRPIRGGLEEQGLANLVGNPNAVVGLILAFCPLPH
eukprot:11190457-Lingulodinium_polyedra.AAC.1